LMDLALLFVHALPWGVPSRWKTKHKQPLQTKVVLNFRAVPHTRKPLSVDEPSPRDVGCVVLLVHIPCKPRPFGLLPSSIAPISEGRRPRRFLLPSPVPDYSTTTLLSDSSSPPMPVLSCSCFCRPFCKPCSILVVRKCLSDFREALRGVLGVKELSQWLDRTLESSPTFRAPNPHPQSALRCRRRPAARSLRSLPAARCPLPARFARAAHCPLPARFARFCPLPALFGSVFPGAQDPLPPPPDSESTFGQNLAGGKIHHGCKHILLGVRHNLQM
jgi:hypothetical protein